MPERTEWEIPQVVESETATALGGSGVTADKETPPGMRSARTARSSGIAGVCARSRLVWPKTTKATLFNVAGNRAVPPEPLAIPSLSARRRGAVPRSMGFEAAGF